jgi:glycosyltransferase involved in cell wall biosynthesis
VEPHTPVLVSLAALEERKGAQWVIRALPRLLPEFRDLRYWVLGEGPHRAALEAEVARLGLQRHVALLGARKDVVRYLAAADIGCLLSYGEAYPIAMLEYLAMGLPVVTSRHPPFNDLVQPAWGAMVCESDLEELAATLGGLLRDRERHQAMSRAGRDYAVGHCTWSQVAEKFLRLFEARADAPLPVACAMSGG